MSELSSLLLAAVIYLGLLALLASAAERGFIPRALTQHPIVYVLGLCVYESTWGYYGNVGFAKTDGYLMLATGFGATLVCLLVPVVWTPLLRLTRNYQLPSLADLFAFRYRSRAVGVAVTLLLLAGSLPYLAQQIQGFTESVRQVTGTGEPYVLGFAFCAALTAFAIFFGHRHPGTGERHEGLAVAIAFEALVKIGALLLAGGFAIAYVFDGPAGLARWVGEHPQATAELMEPVRSSTWSTLVIFGLAATLLHPRLYHMAFAEAPANAERALATAGWMFPVHRLLLALPLPIVLWAGAQLAPARNPDFSVLYIAGATGGRLLTTFVFIGGVSAASAMVIVTTLALGTMSLNHLLLPLFRPFSDRNLYAFVRWGRRVVTALVILAAYAVFVPLAGVRGRLVDFGGFVAFVSVAQFIPGLVGVLFWKRATARGVLAGLAAGVSAWLCVSVVPLFIRSGDLPAWLDLATLLGVPANEKFEFQFFFSFVLNALLFVTVSLSHAPTQDEADAARACAEIGDPPPRGAVLATSPREIRAGLEPVVGVVATNEVERALRDLGIGWEESRPIQLFRLRNRLERNLSALVGPVLARVVVGQGIRTQKLRLTAPDHARDLEQRIAATREPLQGLASELYDAQRYFKALLEQLPIGVCALGPEGRVLTWNNGLAELTGLSEEEVALFSRVEDLPAPWGEVLSEFCAAAEIQRTRVAVPTAGADRIVNLGKSVAHWGGQLLVVEDITERIALRDRLEHKERLAWLGERMARVEHDIQSPVAAVRAIAQNLCDELKGTSFEEQLTRIVERTRSIEARMQSELLLSRGHTSGPARTVTFSASEMLRDAIELVRDADGKRNFDVECPEGLTLWGEQARLTQAVVNLLKNACDASRPGESVHVRASRSAAADCIEIRDAGAGIPPDLLKQIQRGPFVTTKLPGRGTGLGLSQTLQIARAHGGTLELSSREGQGTTAVIYLPLESDGEGDKE